MLTTEKLYQIFIYLLAAFTGFFSPISAIVHTIIFIVLLDCLTAITSKITTLKVNDNIGFLTRLRLKLGIIKSKLLRKTTIKIFFYTLFVMAIFCVEQVIFPTSLYITRVLTFLILINELYSIAENLDVIIKCEKKRPNFVSWLRKIEKLFTNKLNNYMSSNDEEKLK